MSFTRQVSLIQKESEMVKLNLDREPQINIFKEEPYCDDKNYI